jgi:hypothetical protein
VPLVTITGTANRAVDGVPDNRPWYIRATDYQESAPGSGVIITPGADWTLLRPIAGVLSFQAEPGISVSIRNPDGTVYFATIPEMNSTLWDVLSEGQEMGLKFTKTQTGEVVRLFAFRPGEHTDYTLGWDHRLAGDDEIVAAAFEVVDPAVDDPLEVFSATENGYNAQVWARGLPDVGSRYELACTVTTVRGRTLRQIFALEIEYPAADSSPAATDHDYVTPSADRYWRLPANPAAEDVLL